MSNQFLHPRSRRAAWTRGTAALALVLTATACSDAGDLISGPAQLSAPAPVRSIQAAPVGGSDLVPLPFFVRGPAGAMVDASDPATPLYEAILGQPVTAPDGHHVTWGEWSAVRGSISVKCIQQGTHTVLHLAGLIPEGVYTVWNVTFQPPGFTGAFAVPGSVPENVIGFGPAGPSDGSRSAFRASASGRASISTITPPGSLGSLGRIGACALTDEYEWHVVGLYHMDGRSYGPVRGPDGTRAEQFAFIFR